MLNKNKKRQSPLSINKHTLKAKDFQMNEPTIEQIIEARNQCAEIIALHGEKFLPIFERLENEIAIRQKKQELLNKALYISSKIGTQKGTQNGTHLTNHFNLHLK